jgi:EAL domain-containing protein (putative c-di-GMP-specific phosphodiesterase class I)
MPVVEDDDSEIASWVGPSIKAADISTNTPTQLPHGTGANTPKSATGDPATDSLIDLERNFAACFASIHMHFQPIVWTRNRARFGYEALLRSTSRALPHPGAILDAAERLERVVVLGKQIRQQVATTIGSHPSQRGVFFVNLHILDLIDPSLISHFAPLSKWASRVVLEITERESLDSRADFDVRYRIAELRALGFRIAIDDLGGGHERMGTLQPGDVDFLKLDMSLVRGIDTSESKQRLVASVVDLCKERRTLVIGEGVETVAEATTLAELQCDLLQGYGIARPAAAFCDPL